MKVKVKPQKVWQLSIKVDFDDGRPSEQHAVQGIATDMAALVDDDHETTVLDELSDKMDGDAKDHLSRLELVVERL